MQTCMGVVDSGATASLGSVEALEAISQANTEKHGKPMMTVDVTKKPIFRFGNGARSECLSTVQMGMGAGEKKGILEVHVHEAKGQPVLISRKALKALGAVIDFETGDVLYKKVDRSKVTRFVEAENGHLLMPLTGNLLQDARDRARPFVSLLE